MELLPYILLAVLAGGFGLVCERRQSRRLDFAFLLLLTAVMVGMALLRAPQVGIDYEFTYKNYFNQTDGQGIAWLTSPANAYKSEPGYGVLNLLVGIFTDSPLVFAGIASSLIILLRMAWTWKHSSIVWLSVFVYITFDFFGYALCTLRQELAISIALFGVPFLQKRKIVPYMLIAVAAGLFHTSLWIMVPIYFLATLPVNKITLPLYLGGTVCVLLFAEPLVELFIRFVPKYAGYMPGSYFMQGRDFNTALIPVIVGALAVVLKGKLLERNPGNIVLINFSVYAGLLFVITVKHFVFQRVALIFLPAAMLLIPEMVKCMIRPEWEKEAADTSGQKYEKRGGSYVRKRDNLKTAQEMYRLTMGMLMAASVLYFFFLLNTNRLDLVPYLTIFS